MVVLSRIIRGITNVMKIAAMLVILFMMILITVSVISRGVVGSPIIGDYEMVELLMLTLIALGLGYAQAIDGHIKIGLITDRLPFKAQQVIDIIGYLLVIIVCVFIGNVQIQASIDMFTRFSVSTEILRVPQYPFKMLLAIGFYAWALEGFLKLIYTIILMFRGEKDISLYDPRVEGGSSHVG